MRVLDLFCGGGGAAEGYARAGFEVVGVDHDPQPSYPYEFHQVDALAAIVMWAGQFDLIHASPPCQGYSTAVTSRSSRYVPTRGKDEPRLIEPIRDALERLGVPYVIENVAGARPFLHDPVTLCGTMFWLPIPRHRLFETSFPVTQPVHPACRGVAKRYAAERGWEYRDMSMTGKGRHAGVATRWAEISGIRHPMRQRDYSEAILPAYVGGSFIRWAEAQKEH